MERLTKPSFISIKQLCLLFANIPISKETTPMKTFALTKSRSHNTSAHGNLLNGNKNVAEHDNAWLIACNTLILPVLNFLAIMIVGSGFLIPLFYKNLPVLLTFLFSNFVQTLRLLLSPCFFGWMCEQTTSNVLFCLVMVWPKPVKHSTRGTLLYVLCSKASNLVKV